MAWALTYPPNVKVWWNNERTAEDIGQGEACEAAPEEFVESGKAYCTPAPDFVWIEAVAVSATASDVVMTLTAESDGCPLIAADSVTLTAATLEVHDLRHWGAVMPVDDASPPTLYDPGLDATPGSETTVGGAITDGASICMVRVRPAVENVQELGLSVIKPAGATAQATTAQVVGTLTELERPAGGWSWASPPTLPLLPTPQPLPPGYASASEFKDGVAFYVPPETYTDPGYAAGGSSLQAGEETPVVFDVDLGGTVYERSFLLRRPPLVLVHGLWGSQETWDPATTPWHDTPGSGFETRLYRVDYEASNDEGFDWNWPYVVVTIESALTEYQTASDGQGHHPSRGFNGVRYAATRADVVGHSMGGCITRLYISNVVGVYPRETFNTQKIGINRTGTLADGRVYYQRHDNWGAGSIRRFISIGTPFNGSSLAIAYRDGLLAKHEGEQTWEALLNAPRLILQGDPPEPGPGGLNVAGFGIVPNALYDLVPGSEFQQVLEYAYPNQPVWWYGYPSGAARARWHAVVGIASANIPVPKWKDAVWDGVFNGLSIAVFNGLQDLDGTDGDMVVHKNSQSNGQLDLASVFASTVHTSFPGMENFNVETEVQSPAVAARVKELLSTREPNDWQGDLKP